VVIRGANAKITERSLSMKDMTVDPKIDLYLRNLASYDIR
jgi:hypothetical protein